MCVTANDHCCCCHVKVGVEVLGWVGVVLNILGLALVGGMVSQSPTNVISASISIFIYAGLIVAKRTGRHQWYLPFLVINAISLTVQVMALIILLMLLSTRDADAKMLQAILQYTSDSIPQLHDARGLMEAIIVMVILMIAWCCYAHHVVSQAYKCLKRESMPDVIPNA